MVFFARLSVNTQNMQNTRSCFSITNPRGGYKTYNDSFAPPVPGIYLLTTSILVDKNTSIVQLVKNRQVLSAMIVDDDLYSALHESHSTQTAIVELDKGNNVVVQNYGRSDIIFYGGYFSTVYCFGVSLVLERLQYRHSFNLLVRKCMLFMLRLYM